MPDSRPEVNLCDADPLARALARLPPAPAAVDLPTLMYQAGRASRDRSVSRWKRAAFGTTGGLLGTWAAAYVWSQRPADPAAAESTVASTVIIAAPPKFVEAAPMPHESNGSTSPVETSDPFPSTVAGAAGGREYLRVRTGLLVAGRTALPSAAPAAPLIALPPGSESVGPGLTPDVFAAPHLRPPAHPDRQPDPSPLPE